MAQWKKGILSKRMMRAFSGRKTSGSENLNVEVRDRGMGNHSMNTLLPVGW
jgi:hypothetical protein